MKQRIAQGQSLCWSKVPNDRSQRCNFNFESSEHDNEFVFSIVRAQASATEFAMQLLTEVDRLQNHSFPLHVTGWNLAMAVSDASSYIRGVGLDN